MAKQNSPLDELSSRSQTSTVTKSKSPDRPQSQIQKTVTHAEIAAALKSLVEYVNSHTPTPDDPFPADLFAYADEVFSLYSDPNCTIEPAAYEIVLALDEFERETARFLNIVEMGDLTDQTPYGPDSMWQHLRKAAEFIEPRKRKMPEPISVLIAQGVHHRTVAKIYGWYTDSGTPDERKVLDEFEKPGTHFNPKSFIPPVEAKRNAELAERFAARQSNRKRMTLPDNRQKYVKPEAPESLDQLIMGRVPVAQISKMKNIPPDEVRLRAAQLSVFLDPETVLVGQMAGIDEQNTRQLQEQGRIASINVHRELTTIPERVLAMRVDGVQPADILKALQLHEGGSVSADEVHRALASI